MPGSEARLASGLTIFRRIVHQRMVAIYTLTAFLLFPVSFAYWIPADGIINTAVFQFTGQVGISGTHVAAARETIKLLPLFLKRCAIPGPGPELGSSRISVDTGVDDPFMTAVSCINKGGTGRYRAYPAMENGVSFLRHLPSPDGLSIPLPKK